ncbi:MAG: cobalamin-dependent protein [Deltaproteobacteria bacterium]|nr:cobalamin-dependent protein [Deltaproteobacteria bacterium]
MSGRPIRVLIAKPGLDGHDVGAKVLCRALRDAGMEVIYTGLRQSPQAIAAAALQENVQVLGLSVLSGAHIPLCQELKEQLEAQGGPGEVLLLMGGNIPRRDFAALEALGVKGVFPTGSGFAEIVSFIERELSA